MIERLIKKISKTQVFLPDDKLGQMVKAYNDCELVEDNLDLVYAARSEDMSYAAFLRLAQERVEHRKH